MQTMWITFCLFLLYILFICSHRVPKFVWYNFCIIPKYPRVFDHIFYSGYYSGIIRASKRQGFHKNWRRSKIWWTKVFPSFPSSRLSFENAEKTWPESTCSVFFFAVEKTSLNWFQIFKWQEGRPHMLSWKRVVWRNFSEWWCELKPMASF